METDILLGNTCTTTEVSGGHAGNALPQRARTTAQCWVISRAHGRDERISVKGFNGEIEFVYRWEKAIDKLPSKQSKTYYC